MAFCPLAHEMSPNHYQRYGTASYDVHDIERRKKKLGHASIVSRLLPFRNEPSVPHSSHCACNRKVPEQIEPPNRLGLSTAQQVEAS
jgi:hypothetical protein